MSSYAFVTRVPDGKTEALRQLGAELSGAKRADLEDSMRRHGWTAACAWVQTSTQADEYIAYFDATGDVRESYVRFANSTDPFDLWYQRQHAQALDTDFNIPLPEDAVELLYETRDETASEHARPQAVAEHVRSEATGMVREFAAELSGPRRSDTQEFQRRYGLTHEALFLQRRGLEEILIQYAEVTDPERFFYEWPRSEHPFDRWRQQMLRTITGVDYTEIVGPLPELIFHAEVRAGVFSR